METGTITSWKEDKNFGFIKLATTNKEVFFHASDIRSRNKKPSVGEVLQFDLKTNGNGKPRATNIYFCTDLAEEKRRFTRASVILLCLPVLGSMLLTISGQYIPQMAYLIATPLTYLVYKDDKMRAKNGYRRTPEATLHLLELLGGWYGGFYAQKKLFHKNKKRDYQIFFWAIVIIHLILWVLAIASIFQNAWLETTAGNS